MQERFLNIAFRFTSGNLARTISERIWSLKMERDWRQQVANHKAQGGLVITIEHPSGGSESHLI